MRELDPILLTSPSIRCGTTLLQRLLCSSGNGLIYGEEIGKDLQLQLQIFQSRQLVYAHSRPRLTSCIQRVLQGDANDWLIDLMPDIDAYLQALHDGAFSGLAYCKQHAAQAGRHLWGFKYPGLPAQLVQILQSVMPATRIIYITRGLKDCVRSAKSWKAIGSDEDFQLFCAQWIAHVKFMHEWQTSHSVLMLRYEDLVAEPVKTIDQLCAYLPFAGINTSILKQKINNIVQDVNSVQASNEYLSPAELSAQESDWIDKMLADAGMRDIALATSANNRQE